VGHRINILRSTSQPTTDEEGDEEASETDCAFQGASGEVEEDRVGEKMPEMEVDKEEGGDLPEVSALQALGAECHRVAQRYSGGIRQEEEEKINDPTDAEEEQCSAGATEARAGWGWLTADGIVRHKTGLEAMRRKLFFATTSGSGMQKVFSPDESVRREKPRVSSGETKKPPGNESFHPEPLEGAAEVPKPFKHFRKRVEEATRGAITETPGHGLLGLRWCLAREGGCGVRS